MGRRRPTRFDPFVAIDFETANRERSSACAVGLVRVERGAIVHREYRLIRPPTLEFTLSWIHGIRAREVVDEPEFGPVWQKLVRHLADARFIAAHNAPFDRSVLNACSRLRGVTAPSLPFLCTMRLSRLVWDVPRADLETVCAHLGIPLNHHHAGSDAEASARIVLAALEEGRQEAVGRVLGQ